MRTKNPGRAGKTQKNQKGFTLIESLAAISILLVAVTATMSIAFQSIFYIGDARDNITAFYLAQEGVEFVRAVRDGNFLTNRPWFQGLGPCLGGGMCRVDALDGAVTGCGGASCVLKNVNGYYTYSGGSADSPFSRSIQITETVLNREAEVNVTVTWSSKNIPRSINLREHMYNWE